jgi:hypothetical protein
LRKVPRRTKGMRVFDRRMQARYERPLRR